jgi:hypothetical protein
MGDVVVMVFFSLHPSSFRLLERGVPVTLRIRDDDLVSLHANDGAVLTASARTLDATVVVRFAHAYGAPATGAWMRATFDLPPLLSILMGRGLQRHNREEMGRLSVFLPGLYIDMDLSIDDEQSTLQRRQTQRIHSS